MVVTAAGTLPSIGVPPRAASDQPEHRLPALDGVRGVAILVVFLYHSAYYAHSGWLFSWFSWGWMGVDLFFVLSGYLITSILLDAIKEPARYYYGNFYARRFLRLAPALGVFLVALFYIAPLVGLVTPEETRQLRANQAWYWGYLVNVLVANKSSFAVTPVGTGSLWSLAVEEQFYLLWPFLVARAATPRRVQLLSIATIVASMGACAIAWWMGRGGVATYVLTVTRATPLGWGALLASLRRGPGSEALTARLRFPLVTLGGSLLILCAMMQRNPDWLAWDAAWVQLVGFPGLAVFCTGLVAYAADAKSGWLTWRPLTKLGACSYGLYLWHATLLVLLRRATHLQGTLFVMGAAMVCAIPAWLSLVAVERPALRLKHFFPMSRRRQEVLGLPSDAVRAA
jgi:peptidoglycan/LPS O-acetylase OafA/YrhL